MPPETKELLGLLLGHLLRIEHAVCRLADAAERTATAIDYDPRLDYETTAADDHPPWKEV